MREANALVDILLEVDQSNRYAMIVLGSDPKGVVPTESNELGSTTKDCSKKQVPLFRIGQQAIESQALDMGNHSRKFLEGSPLGKGLHQLQGIVEGSSEIARVKVEAQPGEGRNSDFLRSSISES